MNLEELRQIAEAATPGPWEVRTDDADMLHVVHDSEYVSYVCTVGGKEAPNAEADAEFIATFNPQRVLELLDQIERLRDQNARLKAGNHTPAERENWRARFIETHDNNQTLRARLTAIEKLHQPHTYDDEPDVWYCGHCQGSGDPYAPAGRTWPCPTIKAVRGEQ